MTEESAAAAASEPTSNAADRAPGTPPARVAELRKGLADTFRDPEFLEEIEKLLGPGGIVLL